MRFFDEKSYELFNEYSNSASCFFIMYKQIITTIEFLFFRTMHQIQINTNNEISASIQSMQLILYYCDY